LLSKYSSVILQKLFRPSSFKVNEKILGKSESATYLIAVTTEELMHLQKLDGTQSLQ
jgi:hypothetical protein